MFENSLKRSLVLGSSSSRSQGPLCSSLEKVEKDPGTEVAIIRNFANSSDPSEDHDNESKMARLCIEASAESGEISCF